MLALTALTEVTDPSAYGVAELEPDGRVRRFVEKPKPGDSDSKLINAGAYVFEPEISSLIPAGVPYSVERGTFPLLLERKIPSTQLSKRSRMASSRSMSRVSISTKNLFVGDAGIMVGGAGSRLEWPAMETEYHRPVYGGKRGGRSGRI